MAGARLVGKAFIPPFAITDNVLVSEVAQTTIATAVATVSAAVATPSPTQTVSGMPLTPFAYNASLPTNGSVHEAFTRPFILAHALSWPSFRYAYVMWIFLGGVLVVWSLAYQLSGPGAGTLGAHFRKIAIRRIVLSGGPPKKDGKKPKEGAKKAKFRASSTIAQIVAVVGLVSLCVGLSVFGPDYIGPGTCMFGGSCKFTPYHVMKPGQVFFYLNGKPVLDPNGYAPANDPRLYMSTVDVAKSWWSSADRLGLVTYSMLPLCVSLGIKQWPFNLWATPFLTNYHFDKTAILHRWSGRVIYLFSCLHTGAWTIQLIKIRDPLGRIALVDAFTWWRFIGGVCAFIFLNLLMLLSIAKMRTSYYELFYLLHCITALGFLVACAVHGGGVMSWAISAIGLWFLERVARLVILCYINKYSWIFGASLARRHRLHQFSLVAAEAKREAELLVEKVPETPTEMVSKSSFDYPSSVPAQPAPRRRAPPKKRPSYYEFGPGQDTTYLQQNNFPIPQPVEFSRIPSSPVEPLPSTRPPSPPPLVRELSLPTPLEEKGFPGFATAQLLPGRTIRLTINVPSAVGWRPGQHVCLTIPSVRLLQGHCYTISNVDERTVGIIPAGGFETIQSKNTEVVLIIRAQNGFSKALWDYAVKKRRAKVLAGVEAAEVAKGVSMRSLISLPMGSAGRVTWDDFESVVIIVGGTGITFGAAVLEYTCRKMANLTEVAKLDATFKTKRIHFVWIVTEYSHLSWVAPTLRRCLEMSHPSQLQVDVFVSRDPREAERRAKRRSDAAAADAAAAAAAAASHHRDSVGSAVSAVHDADLSDSEAEEDRPSARTAADMQTHIEHTDEMVVFEGELDHRSVEESRISSQIRKEGKLRRALSRKAQGFKPPARSKSSFMPTMEETVMSPVSPTFARDVAHAELGTAGDEAASLVGSSSLRPLLTGRDSSSSNLSIIEDGVEIMMDMSTQDQDDLEVISELARPGRPPVTEIIDTEIDRSTGKTMVCCCGPVILNTLIRNHVSDRIDLKKVRAGDPRGHVSLVAEDFSF